MPETTTDRSKVIVFFGLTASGKTFLASDWAQRKRYPYYNSDQIRKAGAGLSPQSREQVQVGQGIYSSQHTRRTYDEMISRARQDLQGSDHSIVVLDGSYLDPNERSRLVDSFTGACDVYFIYCYCSEEVTRKRLLKRSEDPQAVSDGRWEIYQHQQASFVLPDLVEGAKLVVLNTEESLESLIGRVELFIDQASGQTGEVLGANKCRQKR